MHPEIIFILVESCREENLGAAARAMKIMNISQLRLVHPLCDHLGTRARATAHASEEILQQAKIFDTLEQARADISLLIGTAAKRRVVGEEVLQVEDLAGFIRTKGNSVKKLAVVFGGEESGLSNRQLKQCDILSSVPMHRKYPSLNLGQAVMVYATYLSGLTIGRARKTIAHPTEDEQSVMRDKALQVLRDVDIKNDHIIHRRIMERLMLLNKDDMHLFHSFCKFYLKKYHGRIK